MYRAIRNALIFPALSLVLAAEVQTAHAVTLPSLLTISAVVCPWSASGAFLNPSHVLRSSIMADQNREHGSSRASTSTKFLPRSSSFPLALIPGSTQAPLSASAFPYTRRNAGGVTSAPLPPLMSVAANTGMVDLQRDITFTNDSEEESDPKNVSTKSESFRLAYTMFRPMALSSRQAAPLVVLHGGPSVPSNYLFPIANAIPYRSVLCYDQLGCGASDEPKKIELYSIENAVKDLQAVLRKLGVRRYHLYGQSFGGILAFEFLKQQRKSGSREGEGCLSLILSSTPMSVPQVEAEASRLLQNVQDAHGISGDGDDSDGDSDDSELAAMRAASAAKLAEWFRQEHQCRTPTMPLPLQDAYDRAGNVWRGTKAIPEYVASVSDEEIESIGEGFRMPSAMILRGEHDFVTEPCVEGWKELLTKLGSRSVRYKTLDGCSHHGLLEKPAMYGQTLEDFLCEYD